MTDWRLIEIHWKPYHLLSQCWADGPAFAQQWVNVVSHTIPGNTSTTYCTSTSSSGRIVVYLTFLSGLLFK